MANGNVLYLPAGVSPVVQSGPPAGMPSAVPFDRRFFETILPQSVAAFCSQTACDVPRVEVLTVDGTTHYVTGIIGVHDSWVALQVAKEEHRHRVQTFIPYTTIYRVEVHPDNEKRRHIGFVQIPSGDADSVIKEPPEVAAVDLAIDLKPLAATSSPAAGENAEEPAPKKPARRAAPRKPRE